MRAFLLILLALAPACRGTGGREPIPERYPPEQASAAVELGNAELGPEGNTERALEIAQAVVAAGGDLEPEVRERAQTLLEAAVGARIEELVADGDRPRELVEISELEIPAPLAVRAGIHGAEQWLRRGERMRAFRTVRDLDGRFPLHGERRRAAAILLEVGLDLATDKGRYGLFFRYKSLAPQVLEYLITNHPGQPNAETLAEYQFNPRVLERLDSPPTAVSPFRVLADLYERDRLWELAIRRHDDVLTYFPGTPEALESQWQIPRLRLAGSSSPEFDRTDVERARDELEIWLADNTRHPEVDEVRALLTDSLRRLADNDMIVARFYRRVDNASGAEFHARRGLQLARQAADPEQVAEAEALLGAVAGITTPVTAPMTVPSTPEGVAP